MIIVQSPASALAEASFGYAITTVASPSHNGGEPGPAHHSQAKAGEVKQTIGSVGRAYSRAASVLFPFSCLLFNYSLRAFAPLREKFRSSCPFCQKFPSPGSTPANPGSTSPYPESTLDSGCEPLIQVENDLVTRSLPGHPRSFCSIATRGAEAHKPVTNRVVPKNKSRSPLCPSSINGAFLWIANRIH
jgi:hypothetical protein